MSLLLNQSVDNFHTLVNLSHDLPPTAPITFLKDVQAYKTCNSVFRQSSDFS